jgi:hypothetical protein
MRLAALLAAGILLAGGATASDAEPVRDSTPPAASVNPPEAPVVVLTQEDLAEEEAASAAAHRERLTALRAELVALHPTQGDTPLYVEAWLELQDALAVARRHNLWESEILPALGAAPPAPSPAAVELHRRVEAERTAREAVAQPPAATTPPSATPDDAALEAAGHQTERLRRINYLNQRTNFRHDATIRRLLRLGRDPLEILNDFGAAPASTGP